MQDSNPVMIQEYYKQKSPLLIHNTKTIIADGPVQFRLPYFANRSGNISYTDSDGNYYSKKSSDSSVAEKTSFKFINISGSAP